MFVDEANGDVDNIPSDGEGLDGDEDTSDEESEEDSDVSPFGRLGVKESTVLSQDLSISSSFQQQGIEPSPVCTL